MSDEIEVKQLSINLIQAPFGRYVVKVVYHNKETEESEILFVRDFEDIDKAIESFKLLDSFKENLLNGFKFIVGDSDGAD